jgi:hypothetical protein
MANYVMSYIPANTCHGVEQYSATANMSDPDNQMYDDSNTYRDADDIFADDVDDGVAPPAQQSYNDAGEDDQQEEAGDEEEDPEDDEEEDEDDEEEETGRQRKRPKV